MLVHTGAELGGGGQGRARSAPSRRGRYPRHPQGRASPARSLANHRGSLYLLIFIFFLFFRELLRFWLHSFFF
jgi:hypothetical protein